MPSGGELGERVVEQLLRRSRPEAAELAVAARRCRARAVVEPVQRERDRVLLEPREQRALVLEQ